MLRRHIGFGKGKPAARYQLHCRSDQAARRQPKHKSEECMFDRTHLYHPFTMKSHSRVREVRCKSHAAPDVPP
ncbi:hypothetical protein MESS2_350019 [Mesorhizobium metallidurans STM 2683]|uniref:Uncharacterized protein n=1 Tax=Mesorhizobium metallidurans STM 2683 TaxID=1297569 RepID=M5EQN8_9HYPH|nr:hypothetical protein MESS2_350019 [Mesorhizobium metallidurans STM 2683]